MPSRKILLETIDRLMAANERLRVEVERLSGRVAEVEAELAGLRAEQERPRPPSWVKPNVPERPQGEAKGRKKRQGSFVRKRADRPTQRIVHAVEDCPACGCHLVGGWVKRHRETIEIPCPKWRSPTTSCSSGSGPSAARPTCPPWALKTGSSAGIASAPV